MTEFRMRAAVFLVVAALTPAVAPLIPGTKTQIFSGLWSSSIDG